MKPKTSAKLASVFERDHGLCHEFMNSTMLNLVKTSFQTLKSDPSQEKKKEKVI